MLTLRKTAEELDKQDRHHDSDGLEPPCESKVFGDEASCSHRGPVETVEITPEKTGGEVTVDGDGDDSVRLGGLADPATDDHSRTEPDQKEGEDRLRRVSTEAVEECTEHERILPAIHLGVLTLVGFLTVDHALNGQHSLLSGFGRWLQRRVQPQRTQPPQPEPSQQAVFPIKNRYR